MATLAGRRQIQTDQNLQCCKLLDPTNITSGKDRFKLTNIYSALSQWNFGNLETLETLENLEPLEL
jgi:hypothetical protein